MAGEWKVLDGPVVTDFGTGVIARTVSDGTTVRSERFDPATRSWVPGASIGAVLAGTRLTPEDMPEGGLPG